MVKKSVITPNQPHITLWSVLHFLCFLPSHSDHSNHSLHCVQSNSATCQNGLSSHKCCCEYHWKSITGIVSRWGSFKWYARFCPCINDMGTTFILMCNLEVDNALMQVNHSPIYIILSVFIDDMFRIHRRKTLAVQFFAMNCFSVWDMYSPIETCPRYNMGLFQAR